MKPATPPRGRSRRNRPSPAALANPGAAPAGPAVAALAAGTIAACAARAAYAVLTRRPPGGAGTWTRTNHRGERLTLLEGPALTVGSVTVSALGPGLRPRVRAALALAGTGAAAFGGYDDLAGSGSRRGFRGHLGALAKGEVTTGAVKLGGIGATGLVSAALLGGGPADVAVNAGLVAGGANLLNLFDLRPGRALKVALASGTLLAASARRRGAPVTVAAPLGALLGVAAAASLSRPARLALLAAITGLTAASEVVSFTAVIERTPALRWLDMLGRRPVPAAPVPGRDDPPPAEPREAGTTAAAAPWPGRRPR